jgi:hypothetical protein
LQLLGADVAGIGVVGDARVDVQVHRLGGSDDGVAGAGAVLGVFVDESDLCDVEAGGLAVLQERGMGGAEVGADRVGRKNILKPRSVSEGAEDSLAMKGIP